MYIIKKMNWKIILSLILLLFSAVIAVVDYIVDNNVLTILSKPRKVLSEAVRYYLLSLIPKGRIITWEGLRAFVSKKLGIDIEFEERYEDRLKNINFFSVKKNNDYKEVSRVGNTGWFEKELLEKECFELYKSTKYLYKVEVFV